MKKILAGLLMLAASLPALAQYVGIYTRAPSGQTTWTGDVITGEFGGTGVANTGKTLTLGTGALTFANTAGSTMTFPAVDGTICASGNVCSGTTITATSEVITPKISAGATGGYMSFTNTAGVGPSIVAGIAADNTKRALTISQTWTDGTSSNIGIVANFDMGATGTATGKLLSLQAGAAGTTEVAYIDYLGKTEVGSLYATTSNLARLVQLTSANADSTNIALKNTSTGGKEWLLISGGSSAGLAAAGSYILYNNDDGKIAYSVAPATGNVSFGALAVTKGYAVADLPTGVTGAIAYVTDQAAACPAKGVAPTAGGALVCVVYYTGAAWGGI